MPRRRLVACSGVRDLAVVETDDAILIADRTRTEAGRHLVAMLKAAGRPEALAHGAGQRPWGSFKVLHEGPGCKVKEIVVAPGGRLSPRSHRHRAEHWVVVAGTARVTVDDRVLDLEPNQSVQIPPGARHRMENPGAGADAPDRGAVRRATSARTTSFATRTSTAAVEPPAHPIAAIARRNRRAGHRSPRGRARSAPCRRSGADRAARRGSSSRARARSPG